MNQLQHDALAILPMEEKEVEIFYASYGGAKIGSCGHTVRLLCQSHERLRMENQGYEIVRDDDEKNLVALKTLLAAIVIEDERLDAIPGGLADAIDNARMFLKRLGNPCPHTKGREI